MIYKEFLFIDLIIIVDYHCIYHVNGVHTHGQCIPMYTENCIGALNIRITKNV